MAITLPKNLLISGIVIPLCPLAYTITGRLGSRRVPQGIFWASTRTWAVRRGSIMIL